MENRTSDLWLGLGIGSVIGALVYRFHELLKPKTKEKVCDAFHKISGQAEEMLDTAKEKVLDTGAAVADKVADKTFDLAEKADDLKGKMHTIAADAKNETDSSKPIKNTRVFLNKPKLLTKTFEL